MEEQQTEPVRLGPTSSSPACNKSPKHTTHQNYQQIPPPNLVNTPSTSDGSDGTKDGPQYHHETPALARNTETSDTSPPSPVTQPKQDPIPPDVQQRLEQVTIKTDDDVQNLIREYSKDSSLTQSLKTRISQFIHSKRFGRRREREAEQLKKDLEKEGLRSFSNVIDPKTGQRMLGCEHYPRACKLKAACCNIWVVCRQCHDREEMGHTMPRHDTQFVMCMRCGLVQPVAESCSQCHKQFADYFCDICKFYDNTPGKSIYHCHDCNICRVGRDIDNFHCPRCDACVSKDYAENHRCLKKSLDANCPICGQYLYTSTKPVVFMRCGHTMHSHCFDDYTAEHFTCPLCHKTLTNMTPYYRQIDAELERHVMPDEHKNMLSEILCHDCDRRSVTNYHYVYHKCGHCGSYNTRQIKIFRQGEGSSGDVTHLGEASTSGSTLMEVNSNDCRPVNDDNGNVNVDIECIPAGADGEDVMDET